MIFSKAAAKTEIQTPKTIRLALVGMASSGKTYLLTDLIQSLRILGFEASAIEGDHQNIGDFINSVSSHKLGIRGTKNYAGRQENVYKTILTPTWDKKSKYLFEFIDIPGEVVSKESIEFFKKITQKLFNQNIRFLETTWTIKEGTGTIKTLSINPNGSSEDDDSHTQENKMPYDTQNQGTQVKGQAMPLDPSNYVDNSRLNSYLLQYYDKGDSGTIYSQDLLKEGKLLDYIPDSVVNAIIDIWDKVGGFDFKVKEETGEKTFDKTSFVQQYKNQFFFWLYCMFATDVIFCKLLSLPTTVNRDKEEELTNELMNNFYPIIEARKGWNKSDNQPINWHLAFRGCDSFMNRGTFMTVFQNMIGRNKNGIYSLFVSLMEYGLRKYSTDTEENTIKAGESELDLTPSGLRDTQEVSLLEKEIGDLKNDRTDIQNYFRIKEFGTKYKDCWILFRDYHKGYKFEQFIKVDNCKLITSDSTTTQTLFKLIGSIIASFTQFLEHEAHLERKRLLAHIPRHVFFTGTPIDTDFYIHPHEENQPELFKDGLTSTLEKRLCFGALQLCLDILNENNIRLTKTNNECAEFGKILGECFRSTNS